MISIITCTIRKTPGFAMMADSLRNEVARYRNAPKVEWIIVDGYNLPDSDPMIRRDEIHWNVLDAFSYKHVGPKPTVWQGPFRLTKHDYPDLNNARNTGLAYAKGDYVIFLDDCCEVTDGWLGEYLHARHLGTVVCGTYCSHYKGMYMEGDHRLSYFSGATPNSWFYGINCGAPMEALIKIDGFDEIYGGQLSVDDCDAGVRLSRLGCDLEFHSGCKVIQHLDHHTNHDFTGQEHPRLKTSVLKDGQVHKANDRMIERLYEEPNRTRPVGNAMRLWELRQSVKEGRSFPIPNTPMIDWRDGQSLEEM